MNAKSMKKVKSADGDTMRPEYRREDLGVGIRGKYYKQYCAGTNLVLLDPDVSNAFPNAESVNATLRKAMHATKRINVPTKTSKVQRKPRART